MLKKKIAQKATFVNKPDYVLAILVLGLSFFGLMMIYNVSVVLAYEELGDKLWFFKNQALWLFGGLLAGYFASKIDYHFWQKLALPLLIVSICALVLVLIPGFSTEIMGSRRRIAVPLGIPFFSHINIQASELTKFSLILYLSNWLGNESKKSKVKSKKWILGKRAGKTVSTLIPFLILLGIIAGLVILEPDLGTTIIIAASSLLVYFLSGVNIIEAILVFLLLGGGSLLFTLTSEYRLARLLSFLGRTQDKLGISYHISQILIALGSGGLFGLGLGQSRQKYQYLPEVATDSIFAIIGEELGFLGASAIVILILIIIWRGLKISQQAPDKFGKLLAGGIISTIGIQALVNLGGMVGLLPLTGVPLPFISYGGSSLTILLLGIGILLNISGKSHG